jgi:hypothetical protein
MHLVFADPNSAIRSHEEAWLSNSSRQAKEQNLTVMLQIVEAEKQTSTAPPFLEEGPGGSNSHCPQREETKMS